MSLMQPIDITRIPHKQGSRPEIPLQLPGGDYDLTVPPTFASGRYAASAQVTTLTLTGSVAAPDTTTLTLTPTATPRSSGAPELVTPLTATITGVATLAAAATALIAEIAAQVQLTSLADVSDWQGWADFVTVAAGLNPEDIDFTALEAGSRFTVSLVSDGLLTSSQVSVNDAEQDALRCGTFVQVGTMEANGEFTVEVLDSGSLSADILGVVTNGPGTQAVEIGATFQSYKPGDMARVCRGGSRVVYCEEPATVGGQVYARISGSGVIGAAAANASGNHIAVTGVTFAETTTAAGSAPIRMPNPMPFPS
jgi:hypothetical protein